jgi:hypothetical protein
MSSIPGIVSMILKMVTKIGRQKLRPDLGNIPSVRWLLSHREQRKARTGGEDPLASLYRMYEYIVLDYNTGLRTEIEWFWNHPTWGVNEIPNPNDPDPQRAAILAVIPKFMIMAYNRLIEMGLQRDSPAIITEEMEAEMKSRPKSLEEVPAWTLTVRPLKKTLTIPPSDGLVVEERYQSPEFRMMNVICTQPDVFFV